MNHRQDPVQEATRRLEKNPDDVLALVDRADAFIERQQAQPAMRDIDRALHLLLEDPRLPEETQNEVLAHLYTMRSQVLAGTGRFNEALEAVRSALEAQPNSLDALIQRGRIRRSTGDLDGAFEDFNQALQVDPQALNALVGRGLARVKLNDCEGAIADLDAALALDPGNAVALSSRGYAYTERGDLRKAEADFRRALELNPHSSKAAEWLAYVRQQLDADTSQGAGSLSPRRSPEPPPLYLKAGRLLQRGKVREALALLDEVIETTPDFGMAYALRGQIKGRMGEYRAAVEDLERAVEMVPDDPDVVFDLSLAYTYSGELAKAKQALERVLEMKPDDREARAFYQRLTKQMGQGGAQASPSPKGTSRAPQERELSRAEQYVARGDLRSAFKAWDQEISQASRARDTREEARLRILAGSYYVKAGQQKKGEKYIRKGMQVAEKAGHYEEVAQGHLELGISALSQRNMNKAAQHFANLLEIAREHSDKYYEHTGLGNLGAIYVQTNKLEEGVRLIEQACEIAHEIGDQKNEANYCTNLGMTYLKFVTSGKSRDAAYAHKALEKLRRVQELRQEMGLPPDREIDELLEGLRRVTG